MSGEATSGSRYVWDQRAGWAEQGGEESGGQVWSKSDPLAEERLQEQNEERRVPEFLKSSRNSMPRRCSPGGKGDLGQENLLK